MDISFDCNVSLSKKLRAIVGNSEARFVLVAEGIRDGKAAATLMISGDELDVNAARQSIGKETSVQFTPITVKDEVPSENTVTNIFSTRAQTVGPRTIVDRIAVLTPPEKHEVAYAVKREEEIEVPKAFPEFKEPKFKSFVYSFSDLMMAVKAAQGKESEINPDTIEDPRQKALAIEMKEQAEAIDIPAYIVNDSCSSVTINDMDLSLGLNMPFNLANISAKRLANSGDLKSMLRSNYIRFITPDEVGSFRKKAIDGVELPGLETYSTREDAEDAIGNANSNHLPKAEELYIPVDDEGPSEQEALAGLINLSGGVDVGSGSRTSFHGASSTKTKHTVGAEATVNASGLKTIAKYNK